MIFLVLFSVFIAANAEKNVFAQDIYKEVAKTPGNFLISPFSAEAILALTQLGAKGQSAEELRRALHLPNDNKEIEKIFHDLLSKLNLNTANKIYAKDQFPLKENFQKIARLFRAEAQNVDFTKGKDTAKTINDWVESKTNHKIKNLTRASDFNELTRVVLINSLYFKSNWSMPFLLLNTRKAKFYKTPESEVQVDFLNHYDVDLKYYECPHLKAQYVELPFEDSEAKLVIVLPNDKNGLAELETQLEGVLNPMHQLETEFLNVAVPKFHIESSIDLKAVLQRVLFRLATLNRFHSWMGVSSIFDDQRADLSDMAGEKGDLVVDKVKQSTFIDVSEEGVEAAAATLVLVAVPTSARLNGPKTFTADHPFIFYIKVNGVVVFLGRVVDPSQ